MRVFCKTAFLAAIVSTLACHDAAGPAAIRAQFVLDNIHGRPLPTYPAATPGLTPTILSSTLTLGNDGHASITEHQTEFDGTDVTRTTNYTNYTN